MERINRYYPAIIAVIVILLFAAAGTWLFASSVRESARAQFITIVDAGIADLKADIQSDISESHSIAQAYLISEQQATASRANFQPRLKNLYSTIARSDPDLKLIGVALRVPESERQRYEETLSNDLDIPVFIMDMDETGTVSASKTRDIYFPITFMESSANAEVYFGKDLASARTIKLAMDRALKTQSLAVSETLNLLIGDTQIKGYALLTPIAEERQTGQIGEPIGYIFMCDSYSELLNEILGEANDFAGVALYDSGGAEPSKPVAFSGTGFSDDTNLADVISKDSAYSRKLNFGSHSWTLVATQNPRSSAEKWQMALIGAANLGFIILIGMYMFSSIRRSHKLELLEADLRKSNQDISAWAVKSEQRTFELNMLREMSDMLQACDNTSEAFLVMSLFMYKLFMPFSGAIYILDKNRETAERKVTWGGDAPSEKSFAFKDCIALQSSKTYKVNDATSEMFCGHARNPLPGAYICLPMMAQSETFGLFYLASGENNNPRLDTEELALATTVSEQLAMTLANITLSERLKEQSLTDHLTKLFNRRYLEEMMEREIRRADRNKQTIGFIMFDIDLFKNINDTYGHKTGDRVLETLGIFLKTSVRVEDIACRYGGEEFLLVMPGNDRANTVKRAKEMLERVELLTIEEDGQTLPSIHLSGGVSIYPEDSKDKDSIVKLADDALYEAKRTGRNKVIVWADIGK